MTKQRILVVEDHEALLQILGDLLEKQGYEVLRATNGVEALSIMEQLTPDLILSDIMMPQMDGYRFYENIRENDAWVQIPFIFLTVRGTSEDIKRGKALGVEDYLTKPFDIEEVAVAVRSRLERAHAIQQATEREFDALKRSISEALNHELRTPLNYISGYTELALEDVSELSPEEFVMFLQGIREGVERLRGVIDDMLISVRLDSGRSQEEYTKQANVNDNLGEIIFNTVQAYQHLAAQQQVTLVADIADDLPQVELYPPFFKDALGRLIDNGIKFSPNPPRHVLVKAYAASDEVHVKVIDHGPGIPEEQAESAFERLHQINREELEQQGTGLGLFIARSYIRLHGGDVTLESEMSKGSTFTIILPAANDH